MTSDNSRHRLGLLAITALSLFGALFARLWFLQVVEGETPRGRRSPATPSGSSIEPAPRGRILDRNGVVLVDNRESIVVAIDTQEFAELDEGRADPHPRAAGHGAEPQPAARRRHDRRGALQAARRHPVSAGSGPIPVAEDITVDQEIYFREQADRFPAVVVERQTVRDLPLRVAGRARARLRRLHQRGAVRTTCEERPARDKPYVQTDEIGKSGVEASYEEYLPGHARAGGSTRSTGATGWCARSDAERASPKPGDDVYLAIDVRVQDKTESSLRQGLEERRGTPGELGMFPAEAGAAVVVGPGQRPGPGHGVVPDLRPVDARRRHQCPVWRDLQGLPAAGSCENIDDEIAAIPAEDRPVPKLLNRAIAGRLPAGLDLQAGHRLRRPQARA